LPFRKKIFYGWYIVGAAFLLIILDGLLLYSFGVFLPFLSPEFGISRAEASSIFAVRSVVLAFSLTFAGRLVDRYDPRLVVFSGGLIAALGLIVSKYATNLWEIYLSYGFLIGLGDGVLYITSVAIVSRWFTKRRPLAIGIITTGIPLSGFITPPLTEWLISTFGVRDAFGWLTVVFLLLLTSSFVLRGHPSDAGLRPYGEDQAAEGTGGEVEADDGEGAAAGAEGASWSFGEALRTPVFWLLYVMYMLGFITFLIVVIHLFSYAVDQGHNPRLAAFAPACIGIGSIVGRVLISGFLTEVVRNERVLLVCYAFQGLAAVFVLVTKELWGFYLFGLLFGLFYSGWVPIFPNLLGNFFGLDALGSIYGFFGTSYSVAAIVGPLIAAYLYSATGSYEAAFASTIVFCLLAASLTFLIRTPRKEVPA